MKEIIHLDHTTAMAVRHTLHCLLGCSIGEITGMTVATLLGWPVFGKVLFSIPLAFLFGYLLTSWSVRRTGASWTEAIKTAFATDTISILSMEIFDSAFLLFIPGAMNAHLGDLFYWVKLIASLLVAFIATVPVNRYVISRNPHEHHHH